MSLYRPLNHDSIRVLDFSASDKLRFVHTSLQDSIEFDALSYCWGLKSNQFDLDIDGHVVPVFQNLYFFLLELKARKYQGRLWIDALCIDQGNDEEKGYQIPNMREVYSKARCVIIWLGNGSEFIEAAIRDLSNLVQFWEQEIRKLGPEVPSAVLYKRLNSYTNHWHEYTEIMFNPWFSRLWTLQEVVLARLIDVWYGTQTVRWDDLSFLSDLSYRCGLSGALESSWRRSNKDTQQYSGFSGLKCLNLYRDNISKDPDNSLRIQVLVQECRQRAASEPNDKVYGLLGVVHPDVRDDWREWVLTCHQARDTYVRFARYILSGDQELVTLSSAQRQRSIPGLPSWCPDFSCYDGIYPIIGLMQGFHAGQWPPESVLPQTQNDIILGSNPDIIEVPGLQVDFINKIIDGDCMFPNFENITRSTEARDLLTWESRCLALSKEVLDCPGVPEEHWRTLCGNRLQFEATKTCISEDEQYYADFKQQMQATAEDGKYDFSSCSDYANMVFLLCQERTYFSTRSGRIGLGPARIQPDDLVCVFRWAAAPFILRRIQMEPIAKYELMGDAYVHGIMYGELAEQVRVSNETFVIE